MLRKFAKQLAPVFVRSITDAPSSLCSHSDSARRFFSTGSSMFRDFQTTTAKAIHLQQEFWQRGLDSRWQGLRNRGIWNIPQRSSASMKPWLARFQSTSTDAKGLQQKLSQIVVKQTAAARDGASRASSSVMGLMPSKARKLISDASRPGHLQRALKLQLEAFWGNHSGKLLAIGGAVVVYALWRSLFAFASMFFKFSETMADFGFLALAAALASFGFLYVRRLYTINPDSIYRLAMLQLNTNPAILEVMGAPVAGSNVRASVVTGGGLRMKGLQPKLRSRRVQMIFPLTGSERRGLVSLEAKKLKGKYLFKLLAVDVPTAAGPEQRLFLEGDEKAYARGGVVSELRDPFLQALSLRDANELEDEIDDAAADADAESARRAKKAAKLKKGPKPIDEGGGMYFYERAWLGLRQALSVSSPVPTSTTAVSATVKGAAPLVPMPEHPPPVPKKAETAEKAEVLNPGTIPKQPTGKEGEILHQYKKEASSQQAP